MKHAHFISRQKNEIPSTQISNKFQRLKLIRNAWIVAQGQGPSGQKTSAGLALSL
jgi:hypothetical protein